MNFGPHIDPSEVLVHCKLTQVHTPRGSLRGHLNHVKAYWCAVMRRFTTMVGTTYEPCGLVESGAISSGNAWERRSQSYFDSENGVSRNEIVR